MFYAARRKKREAAEALVIGFNAARGDPREVKATVKEAMK